MMDKLLLIRELSKIMREENLSVVEMAEAGFGIKMGREPSPSTEGVYRSHQMGGGDKGKLYDVRSPLVGKYMAALNPTDPPLTPKGKQVSVGDVLCYIKTGNQINEIACDKNGQVVEVMVTDGEKLPYDKIMFKILAN